MHKALSRTFLPLPMAPTPIITVNLAHWWRKRGGNDCTVLLSAFSLLSFFLYSSDTVHMWGILMCPPALGSGQTEEQGFHTLPYCFSVYMKIVTCMLPSCMIKTCMQLALTLFLLLTGLSNMHQISPRLAGPWCPVVTMPPRDPVSGRTVPAKDLNEATKKELMMDGPQSMIK